MKRFVALLGILSMLATAALAGPDDEKFGVYIVGGDDAAPVVKLLKQKMLASKPFEPVPKTK